MMNEQERNLTFNDDFFKELLHRVMSDEIIRNVTIKNQAPATQKGDNFMSEMWRYILKYSSMQKNYVNGESDKSVGPTIEKEISLIVKIEFDDLDSDEERATQSENNFDTEIRAFRTILPNVEKLVGSSIAPKCLHAQKSKSGRSFLVLEDLTPLSFAIKNRQSGLSLPYVIMVLETIARFHAASIVQYEQNPEFVKSFTKGVWSNVTPINLFRTMEQTLRMVSDKCRDWPNPEYQIISKKLRVLEDKFAEEIVNVSKYDETEFCVLNHGDCWTNNIMFREDENGKPIEVRLIDFQLLVYSSPVIDLIYFLSICPSSDIESDQHAFFSVYLQKLKLIMQSLKCKAQPPTIVELLRAAMKRRMYIVMGGLMFRPRIFADKSEIESFAQLIESGVTRMNIFKNPAITVDLKKSLLFMNSSGYLD